jgi:hypothetical protein
MLKVGFRAIHGLNLPTLQASQRAREASKEALKIKRLYRIGKKRSRASPLDLEPLSPIMAAMELS